MDENKLKGFIPLQELQRMAQEKIRQQKEKAIQNPQQNTNKLVVDTDIFNKYQITKDSTFYIKFGIEFIEQQQDRIVITQYDKSNTNIQNHWLKFRMWSYQECNSFRDLCCQQDQYRNYVYNKTKLFKMKVKHLLLDWSFKQSDPNMRLMHVNGILSDQSIDDFMRLHTNILFYVQRQLNNVLQANM